MTDMADTIELLEAIGSDASLRYAQGDELMGVLEQAQASTKLMMAVGQASGALLREGYGLQQVPQVTQAPTQEPGHGDEEEEEGDAPQSQRPQSSSSSPQSCEQGASY